MKRAALVLLPLALAGCRQEMDRQHRFAVLGRAPPLPHGAEAQAPPPGTVPRGAGARVADIDTPPPVTPALLARGRERFGISCAPCHGPQGDGDGMIVRRGFPRPPSYHSDRLRAATANHLLGVIAHGSGRMYAYGDRVEPADRWAIVAYVRALQLSRAAPLSAVPDAVDRLP